jgi:hypothetical protein
MTKNMATVFNVIKLLFFVTAVAANKLNCLTLASLFQACLVYASKAIAYPMGTSH